MKLPEKFWIVIHSEAHSKLVQDKLFKLGYEWTHFEEGYCPYTIGLKPDYKYGSLSIAAEKNRKLNYSPDSFFLNNGSYTRIYTDDLLSIETIKEKMVWLNSTHEAAVSSDGTIKVGRQTFSHEIVKSLAQAIEEVTK